MTHYIQVTEEDTGKRVDKFIVNRYPKWSRAKVQSWIKNHLVLVNDQPIKGNYRLKADEVVQITPPVEEEFQIVPEDIPLDIRYEDHDLLIVNKPRGLVVHPGPGYSSGTLVNALLYYCKNELSTIAGMERPGIVHRIDKDTSGLLVVAKNDQIHQALSEQFKRHEMERIYTAIVEGLIPHQSGTIEAPIGRDPVQRTRRKVDVDKGRTAITHFTVRKKISNYTWVDCRLETGRTHQIRVHMKYIGYPIVGDRIYGSHRTQHLMTGQALHAKELRLIHPRTQKPIHVTAELPEDFKNLLKKIEK